MQRQIPEAKRRFRDPDATARRSGARTHRGGGVLRLSFVIGLALIAGACGDRPATGEKAGGETSRGVDDESSRGASDEAGDLAGNGTVVGTLAPDVTFRTLGGASTRLRDAEGPVLVSFWATDCAICLAESPELVALRERYRPRGFELVSVAMPYDRPDAVLELVAARGWPQPIAIDIDGRVLAGFEPVPGTPTNFLIDAGGTIVGRWVGKLDMQALEHAIVALLPSVTAPRG